MAARTSTKEAFDKLGIRVLTLEQTLVERDAKIAELEAQLKTLGAKTGRPVAREDALTVKALPKLEGDPKTGRCVCPTDAGHGTVMPNTRGLCPRCYTKAVWAASPAGKAALAAQEKNETAIA